MKRLSNKDYELLKNIAQLEVKELRQNLTEILIGYGYKNITSNHDFVFGVGNIPIALLAHMDTVFPKPPINFLYDKQQGLIWSPQGAGFDDRAGIFLILKILEEGYRPHIIFTNEEESGGLGAQSLVAQYPQPFAEIKYIIELDRAGKKDCVFYDCDNREFEKYICSFGFETAIGSFTDISFICPIWKIAGVNLSVGYDNEHTYFEILNTFFLVRTFNKVINMLKDVHNVKKPYEYISYNKSILDFSSYDVEYVTCSQCNKVILDYEAFNVLGLNDNMVIYCPDCIVDKVEWCDECIRPFEIDPSHPEERTCRKCLTKKYKTISLK